MLYRARLSGKCEPAKSAHGPLNPKGLGVLQQIAHQKQSFREAHVPDLLHPKQTGSWPDTQHYPDTLHSLARTSFRAFWPVLRELCSQGLYLLEVQGSSFLTSYREGKK